MRRIALALGVTAALAVSALAPACAANYNLIDGNSVFQIDPATWWGAWTWSVDGVDHLWHQQWYYRLDSISPEQTINNLGTPTVTQPTSRDLYVTYTTAGFRVELYYGLTGGGPGSGTSDVSERFRITNNSASSLSFYLFQFSNFDLLPDIYDDIALHVNANTIRQWDSGHAVTESVSRTPDRWEVNNYGLLNTKLTDGDADDLINGLASYAGDAAWAFQWNLIVPAGGEITFSKDKTFEPFVPEPGGFAALAAGLMALVGGLGRRRMS